AGHSSAVSATETSSDPNTAPQPEPSDSGERHRGRHVTGAPVVPTAGGSADPSRPTSAAPTSPTIAVSGALPKPVNAAAQPAPRGSPSDRPDGLGQWRSVSGPEIVLLLCAGVGGGLAGSIGGLASLVSYPALLAAGLSPVTANVTNTVSMVFSGAGAAAGSR